MIIDYYYQLSFLRHIIAFFRIITFLRFHSIDFHFSFSFIISFADDFAIIAILPPLTVFTFSTLLFFTHDYALLSSVCCQLCAALFYALPIRRFAARPDIFCFILLPAIFDYDAS
jgi:hypothetical protein